MKTKKLTVSALMLALATVLSLYSVYKLPGGGSITPGSMVPVILLSFMFGTKWGIFSALCYSIIQCVIGFSAPPVQNFASFLIVVLFDYVLAFGSLGLANLFYTLAVKKRGTLSLSVAICVLIRFLCHIISGVAIWSVYAPKGQSPLLYSLIYNGSYMLPETIISTLIAGIISGKLKKHGILK